MRRRLALRVTASTVPYAWTAAELIVPKRGEHSVGVHRHVDTGTARTVNCQRSIGFFLATDVGGFPVDWSLVLRDVWESDNQRRDRARIPETESGHPMGAYVMDFADSVAGEPGLPDVPWALDLTRCEDAAGVLAGLVRRRLDFACEVDAGQLVVVGAQGSPTVVTVGELMDARSGRRPRTMVRKTGGGAIYGMPVRLPLFDTFAKVRPHPVGVLEWTDPSRERPTRYWITSCMTGRVGTVLSLMRARNAALETVTELREQLGALAFEGRSFPGWHHHMTMASAAYAYRSLFRAGPVPATSRGSSVALTGAAC